MSEVKKKPGRPRKHPVKTPLMRNGISNAPKNTGNRVEFIYDTPVAFKKIFALFKSMAVQDMCIKFTPREMHITTSDHLRKSNIKVVVNCTKVNHYYCKETTECYLNPPNIEKIIRAVDKNHLTITFVLREIMHKKSLDIILKNEINIDEHKEINLIKPRHMHDAKFDTSGYPISFTFPSKDFKKIVNDASAFSNIFTISKVGLSSLMFTYISKDKMVKSRHIVRKPDAIKLNSTVKEGDIFSSSVQIDYIKPLSSSLLADDVSVYADNYKNMIFSMDVDVRSVPTIRVQITTSTVNLK